MTEVRFYHIQKQVLDDALPAILQKAIMGGKNIMVQLRDEAEVTRMNKHLWTFKKDVFLPHGGKKDGFEDKQPIYLSANGNNPNNAKILILTQGTICEDISPYDLCCEILDGRDEQAITQARARWKDYQAAGHEVTYWFQNENGGWEKKA